MTVIVKYPLERMRAKAVEVSFVCPNCEGTRLQLAKPQDFDPLEGVRCYKCKALILLDSLSVTVVREAPGVAVRS